MGSPGNRGRLIALVAIAIALVAVVLVVVRGPTDKVSPPSAARAKTSAMRAAPKLPEDAAGRRARLESLRYLELGEDGATAVIDDSVEKRSYFARAGGDLLTSRVTTVTKEIVTLVDPIAGTVTLPHAGRLTAAPTIHPPMEVEGDKVPVHMAPSLDPEKVAMERAYVQEYLKTVPHGTGQGGGGGGRKQGAAGGGHGGGRDPMQQGGPGRQRRLAREAAEAAAATGSGTE